MSTRQAHDSVRLQVVATHGCDPKPKPVCPLTTGAIIDLRWQDGSFDKDKNVGQAVTYGRTFLQQLPRSLRDTVLVALTNLQHITLMRVRLLPAGDIVSAAARPGPLTADHRVPWSWSDQPRLSWDNFHWGRGERCCHAWSAYITAMRLNVDSIDRTGR